MIVLDASVLIGFMFDQDAHHDAAVALLRDAARHPFGVSQITLAESLVSPTRLGRLRAAEQMLRDVGITEVPFPTDAAPRLAQLRVECGLRLPDCCVLLAAESTRGSVATFDARLARAAVSLSLPVIHG